MFKNIKKTTAVLIAVVFFVALDRFLKVFAFYDQAGEHNLLGGILKFSYKSNYYIAFSLPLAGWPLTILIALIIIVLITFGLYHAKKFRAGRAAALFIIILGAGSNLYDRLKYGFVIDYLDLKYFTVFNLADAMIVAGVAVLLISANKKEAI